MKDKLIAFTYKLTEAGFTIQGIDVEASDIVRIRFHDLEGLELLLNDSYAKIEAGECSKKSLEKLKKIILKHYELKDNLESIDNDMYNKLLNAS